MGSNKFYREERPGRVARQRRRILRSMAAPVTNAGFFRIHSPRRDIRPVRDARLIPPVYPGADPEFLVPGFAGFHQARPAPVDLRDLSRLVGYVPGANWRHSRRSREAASTIAWTHPVVHIAFRGCRSLCRPGPASNCRPRPNGNSRARRTSRRDLRLGRVNSAPAGQAMANTWQGRFPFENLAEDGFGGTSPVGAFPANGFGLYEHDRQRLEWDRERPYAPAASGKRKTIAAARPKRPNNPHGKPRRERRLRISARRTIACATGPRRGRAQTLDTPRPRIFGFRCVMR